MDATKPPSLVAQRRTFASRLFGYDVFLSFALGPPPRGSHSYASDLARRLEQRDFTVFFSEHEMPPGEQLDGGLRKALLRSRALVVISNRGTLQDPRWVRTEVEEFRRARLGRPVIPVNIGGALQDPSVADAVQSWLDFAGRVWVDDTEEAIARGIASQEVVDRLAVGPRSARANVKWRWIVRGTVTALCALALGLGISSKIALDNAKRARAELRDAVASRLVIQGQQMLDGSRVGGDLRGIHHVLAASRISTTQETTGALLDALLATRNMRKLLATDVPVESLSISPDGRRIASGHQDHKVRLWDAATGQPLGSPLEGHLNSVVRVAFSPDGRLLATGSWDGILRLWNAETGEARGGPVEAHGEPVTGLAFSPDGRRIVSCGLYGDLTMWDSVTRRSLTQPAEPYHQVVLDIAFSPDGGRVVSVGDRVTYWDAATAKPIGIMTQQPPSGRISAVAFSPDGRSIVTGSGDGTLRLWDSLSGMPKGAPLEGHTQSVRSVAFSSDGRRIVSGSSDGTLRLWDTEGGKLVGKPLEGHRAPVTSVAFCLDGAVVSGSTGAEHGAYDVYEPDAARIRLWMPLPGESLGEVLSTHRDNVRSVAFSPNGRRIATGGDDKTVRVWDAATGEPLGPPMEGHQDSVRSVAFSPDGRRIASGSFDRTIRIWDVATGRPVGPPLTGHKAEVLSVAFSPDGQRLASGSAQVVRMVRDSMNIYRRTPGKDGELRLWDATTGSPISVSTAQTEVTSVAFDPSSLRVVSAGSDGRLRLWDARSGEMLGRPIEAHPDCVNSVAFSPDGRLIASCSRDKTVRLWDSETGKPIGHPLQGRSSVESIAFSPDGRQLVSGGVDKMIRLWDTQSGRPLGSALQGHTAWVEALAFSPDGLTIVSAALDNTVRRWPAPKSWEGLLCSKITRNLSPAEWREWVSTEIPYECQCSGLPIPANDGRIEPSRICSVK